METEIKVPFFDLIMSMTEAIDLISPLVKDHHLRVAYIAQNIASLFNLPPEDQNDVLVAAALHDIGAIGLKERTSMLNLDFEENERHVEIGYELLGMFEPLKNVSKLVRYHHTNWDYGAGKEVHDEDVPTGSQIIFLADRISVLIDSKKEILGQVDAILKTIKSHSDERFRPDLVEAFEDIAGVEYFWLNVISPSLKHIISATSRYTAPELKLDGLTGLAKLFSHIIDFKSPYTASHSLGVAAVAEKISLLVGFDNDQQKIIRTAGLLHDLGKLSVPPEILDLPRKLTKQEFNLIKSHSFHTYRILDSIPSMEMVKIWGSLHHEKLDGTGYPFHYKNHQIPLGSRIISVADIFTALTEDRPYRKGMDKENTMKIMLELNTDGSLDPNIVDLIVKNYEEIDHIRHVSQMEAKIMYDSFILPLVG